MAPRVFFRRVWPTRPVQFQEPSLFDQDKMCTVASFELQTCSCHLAALALVSHAYQVVFSFFFGVGCLLGWGLGGSVGWVCFWGLGAGLFWGWVGRVSGLLVWLRLEGGGCEWGEGLGVWFWRLAKHRGGLLERPGYTSSSPRRQAWYLESRKLLLACWRS